MYPPRTSYAVIVRYLRSGELRKVSWKLTTLLHCHLVSREVSMALVLGYHLSPSPCATMTVEVCFFSAGTTNAAALDMFAELDLTNGVFGLTNLLRNQSGLYLDM